MSLLFGGATSDRVDIGTDTRLTALADLTVFGWIYPTSLINNRDIARKGTNTNARAWEIMLNGTAGNCQLIANGTSGTGADAQIAATNDTPFSTINKWYWLAVAMSWGVSTNIYVGDLNTLAVIRSLSGGGQLGGTQASDTGGPLIIGNRNNYDRTFPGRIGIFGVVPGILSLHQIHQLQFQPRSLGIGPFYQLGDNGTGPQPDLSGGKATGTVTGATLVSNPPLGYPLQ